MGDIAKISPHIPFTCTQNAFLSLLNIHIIPRHQIYVAIDNPSLVPSITCLTMLGVLSYQCNGTSYHAVCSVAGAY